MTRIWIDTVSKKDARKLVSWWNSQRIGNFFYEKKRFSKFYDVTRE